MMRTGVSGLVAVIIVAIGGVLLPPSAEAATPALTVGLGSADTFSVVAGSYVTLAGSNVGGDVGAVGAVTAAASTVGGTTYELNTAKAPQARADVLAAYTSADGRTPTGAANSGVLGGQTLTAGVHHAVAAYGLTGKLTLDGGGDTGAVFILQTEGAIVAAAGAKIALINGAKAVNVFWQTPTHVVFGAGSKVVGTFLAGSYITFGAGSALEGRAFSNTGYVVLATTSITAPAVVPPVVTPPVVVPPVVTPPVVTPPVVTPPVVVPPVVTPPVVTPPVVTPAGPQGPAGVDGVGTVTVTATAQEGFILMFDSGSAHKVVTCTYVFTDEPCAVDTPPTTTTLPVEKLAATGATMTGLIPLAFGLLLVGAGFMVFRHQGLVLR